MKYCYLVGQVCCLPQKFVWIYICRPLYELRMNIMKSFVKLAAFCITFRYTDLFSNLQLQSVPVMVYITKATKVTDKITHNYRN